MPPCVANVVIRRSWKSWTAIAIWLQSRASVQDTCWESDPVRPPNIVEEIMLVLARSDGGLDLGA